MPHAPPGPTGRRLIGNIQAYEQNRLGFLLRCAREYGDIVRFSDRTYIVNSPELIAEVFKGTNRQFQKVHNFLREEVDEQNTAEWMRARRAASKGLAQVAVEAHGSAIVSAAEALVDSWKPGQRLVILPEMERLTSGIIARFCFGNDGDRIPSLSAALLDTLFPIVSSPFRFPYWLPIWRNINERWAEHRLAREIDSIIERRCARAATTTIEPPDLLSVLLAPQGDILLPKRLVRKVLVGTILAAHGVPAAALSWIWFLLSKRPGCYAQLRGELARVLNGRSPSAADLSALPYTKAVVKETLRLYPPTWLVARKVVEHCELGGYPLHPGQALIFSSYVVGRDPRYFPEPQAFIPERWLIKDWVQNLPKYAYFPFGGGSRVCMGRNLALTELTLLTAAIGQRVCLRVPDDIKVRANSRRSLLPEGLEVTASFS